MGEGTSHERGGIGEFYSICPSEEQLFALLFVAEVFLKWAIKMQNRGQEEKWATMAFCSDS